MEVMPERRVIYRWLAATGILTALVLLVAGIITLMQWSQDMNRRMTTLTTTVEQAAQDARRAADQAVRSSAAAEEARTQSRAAEAEKKSALQQKSAAEDVAAEATREAESARAEVEKVRKEREQEMARLQQALDRIVDTRRTAFGLVMNLPEAALRFDFNSATLRHEARETLSKVAGILMTSDNFGLAIHGHTDDIGSSSYNQQLSERRAEAVKEYMVSAGIDPDIITIRGYGKSSPLSAGRDDAARAKNRRVEIALTDSTIQYRGEQISN